MARILSVSYDAAFMRTRNHLLKKAGHVVESARGLHAALDICRLVPADLLLVGQYVPFDEKRQIIDSFRDQNPQAAVLVLTRTGEPRLKQVDYVNPGDLEELLRVVEYQLSTRARQRSTGVPFSNV